MPDISYIARRRRARLVARDDRVYAELRREWQAVRRAVAAEVDAIAARIRTLRARGLTPAQMRAALDREQRLIRLEALVAERVQAFGEAARSIAAAHAEAAATRAPDDARAMIGWGTPPEITLDTVRLPIEAVQELVSVVRSPQWAELFADRMLADGRSLSAALGDELRDGLALGRNPRRIASAMRRVAAGTDGADPLPLSRARTIARTEAMRAYREASRATYAANDALVSGWVWIAGLDRRTCGSCIAQHGSEHPHDEVMATHPNCFPAGVVVSGPAPDAATRRWWEGDLVEIHTAGGARLPVTPNHPLLTPDGWVPAHLIDVGGHLIRSRNGQRMHAAIDPDSHQVPALIEDVCDALRRSCAMTTRSVPAAAMDFHGDSFDSDVDVVWADRLLWNRTEAPVSQPAREESLSRRDVGLLGLPGGRPGAEGIESVLLAPACSVCGLDVAPVLFRGSVGSHESVGLSDPPSLNARLGQHPRDRYPGDAVSGAELLFALAGEVQTDEVVEVRRLPFAGHVYNLQTGENWYSANGIITHNCRCVAAPLVRSWRELGFPGPREPEPVASGQRWFAALPEREQVAILGRAKARAVRARAIALADLVERRNSPQWGPSSTEASLVAARRNAERRRALARAA